MTGSLIIPLVRVNWNGVNLSAYDGPGNFPQGQPLVYDVEVDFQESAQGPTAKMKWDPTGPGFAEYERIVSDQKYMESVIYIDFFYIRGKRIRFAFVWSGQSINYGNDMSVTVMMISELGGLINWNIRNAAQAFDEKKGVSFLESINRGIKQFGVPENLVKYNEVAKKDLQKAKLTANYSGGNDQTFGAFVSSTVEQNGNNAFASNIEEPSVIIFPPYTWDQGVEVKNGATDVPPSTSPKPEVRYGYFLGPSIINSIQRESQWKPPQQTNQKTPAKRVKPQRTTQDKGQKPPSRTLTEAQKNAQRITSSPLGIAGSRSNPGIINKENPDGPEKQLRLNEERGATLTFQTMLTPVLVGIKPYDILFIPNFKGDFMEDWQVTSVSYDQNDGNVSVSVSAGRKMGTSDPMVASQVEKFKKIARELNLVGPNATLDAWDLYAWSLSPEKPTANSAEGRIGQPPPQAITPEFLAGV